MMTRKEAIDILKEHSKRSLDPALISALNEAVLALEEQEKISFIYQSPTDFYWDKAFKEVERALGFRLFAWQKDFIQQTDPVNYGRRSGKTTAYILKLLLSNVDGRPLDFSRRPNSKRDDFFRKELISVKKKLDEAGVPTRKMFFSEKEKLASENHISDSEKIYYKLVQKGLREYGLSARIYFGSPAYFSKISKTETYNAETNTTYEHYYVDGTYAFTISISKIVGDDHSYTTKYRKIVDEDLKKRRVLL